MITKQEIEDKARDFAIHTSNVQRDYVFGWLLMGIYSASPLKDVLILKGGNGLRKAYFENTRFSDDLDFATESAVSEEALMEELNKVCDVVQQGAGIVFEKDRNKIQEKQLSDRDRSRKIYQARLYFKDFYGNSETIVISIRMDITEFDKIFLPTQSRNLIHPYSDVAVCTASLRCLKLEEMLAAKLKCLLQRRYSFDLYDYVYSIFINRALAVDRGEIVSVFLRKTIFQPSPGVVSELLLGLPFQVFRAAWDKYIVAPVGSLIAFEQAVAWFTESIKELFGELTTGYGRSAFFPARLRNPILEAGSGLKLLAVTYDGVGRRVEPYSLVYKRRKDGAGQEYLYVYDQTGGRDSGPGVKSFVNTKISSIEVLNETFEPRHPVELAKAGEYSDKTYFSKPFGSGRQSGFGSRSAFGVRRSSVIYVIECSYCGKQFRRLRMSTQLKAHKDGYGNACFGRAGYLVDQRYP